MNPSTENLYNAIMAVPAKVVFVFPNNKNILMAARQACELITDRKTVIIPTRTVPQGIAAMLAYDEQATVELNVEYMMEAAKRFLLVKLLMRQEIPNLVQLSFVRVIL